MDVSFAWRWRFVAVGEKAGKGLGVPIYGALSNEEMLRMYYSSCVHLGLAVTSTDSDEYQTSHHHSLYHMPFRLSLAFPFLPRHPSKWDELACSSLIN